MPTSRVMPGARWPAGTRIDSPEPLYGMAVTGIGDPDRLLRKDAARAGLPLSLTKPLGVGVLNSRHKATGEVFPHAVASMVALNAEASRAALAAGAEAATDVTGFGLLGHLATMLRSSGVGARLDVAAVPLLDGARDAVRDGFVSGGTRRNLEWVRPFLDVGPGVVGRRPGAARRRPDQWRAARGRRGAGWRGDRGDGRRAGPDRPVLIRARQGALGAESGP